MAVTIPSPTRKLPIATSTRGLPVGYAAEFGPADVALAAIGLAYRTDGEATALLARLAAASDRAVVVEELDGPGLEAPGAAEHKLIDLAATGVAVRSREEIAVLAAAAGWTVVTSTTLGWNYEAIELVR